MKRRLFFSAIVIALSLPGLAPAQLGELGEIPIEITADGETKFEGGIAIADDNVTIHYGGTSIYCEHAEYTPESKDILLSGRVRIYREGDLFLGERAIYNLEKESITATGLLGGKPPFYFSADTLSSASLKELAGQHVTLTTHDSSKPDFNLRARKVRIYPDDRIIFSNITVNVGETPVFWLPYLYQSLDKDSALIFAPGYGNTWGAYLLTRYTFPVTQNIRGTLRLDLRADRGVAAGLDLDSEFGKDKRSYFHFEAYGINDLDTTINNTGLDREPIDEGRYRFTFKSRTYITDELSVLADINVLSDDLLLYDFYPSEYRLDPQPDNVISLTQLGENYAVSLTARAQLNDFFETTERLPDLSAEITRTPLWKSGAFYEGSAGVANLSRKFAEGAGYPDYDALRFDTFHQVVYPKTLFGWLSVNPRVGVRATYYDQTGMIDEEEILTQIKTDDDGKESKSTTKNTTSYSTASISKPSKSDMEKQQQAKTKSSSSNSDKAKVESEIRRTLAKGGGDTRINFLAGFESSFKLSAVYDDVQMRALGLDGMRHIIQPYTNFSYVSNSGIDPQRVLQFDRLVPSTRLAPIDFPLFNTIDAIDSWTLWRLGVRNRLQTRRGDNTFSWLSLDTFFDVNIDSPYDDTDLSNLWNVARWDPLPWLGVRLETQAPVFDDGFSEVNTMVRFQPVRDFEFWVGHRYLSDNDYILDSSLGLLHAYYQINDNWGFSCYYQYEFEDGTLERQSYTLHRDLSAWVASVGLVVDDNRGETEWAALLTFTLKGLPQVNLPFSVDTGQASE